MVQSQHVLSAKHKQKTGRRDFGGTVIGDDDKPEIYQQYHRLYTPGSAHRRQGRSGSFSGQAGTSSMSGAHFGALDQSKSKKFQFFGKKNAGKSKSKGKKQKNDKKVE